MTTLRFVPALALCLNIAWAASPAPVLPPTTAVDARITTGAYLSNEDFASASGGQTSNDFATVSSRLFLKIHEPRERRYELISDFRDKHDFFDKLDRERLELRPGNSLQIRQLSLALPNLNGSAYGTLGRFAVTEAGSAQVDGIEAGWRFNETLRASAFLGWNPRREDRTYLEFQPESQVAGVYALLQPPVESWNQYHYLSSALVTERNQGHTDRTYWFNNFVYQWNSGRQLMLSGYLDFVPRIYLQNAMGSFLQKLSEGLTITVGASAIDVVQYSRRQGILELLEPSPYRELNSGVRYRLSATTLLEADASSGRRSVDSLSRSEFSLGPSFSQFLSRHLAAQARVGIRKNFTSHDSLLRLRLGYYSNLWELDLGHEAGLRREGSGDLLHPALSDVNLAITLSKVLYGTLSYEVARDERVSVNSFFFKIGYRLGTQGLSPLRDGAPPRGRL